MHKPSIVQRISDDHKWFIIEAIQAIYVLGGRRCNCNFSHLCRRPYLLQPQIMNSMLTGFCFTAKNHNLVFCFKILRIKKYSACNRIFLHVSERILHKKT